jgi:hypothetical protein
MNRENYVFRKKRLLRSYDRSISRVQPLLSSQLGRDQSIRLIQESRQEYEHLIPRIPFIGRSNPLLGFFLPATRYLAVHRVLKRQGLAIEEIGQLIFVMGAEEVKAIPPAVRRIIGNLWFSQLFKQRIKRRAILSHQRRYRGDFVLDYVNDDGKGFDFGVDYIECASCKFLQAEDALELAPYVCAVDLPASHLLGWGLTRTMTLAEGSQMCDFRFRKGGRTCVSVPQSLNGIIEQEPL